MEASDTKKSNCFSKAGFTKDEENEIESNEEEESSAESEDEMQLEEWDTVSKSLKLPENLTFVDFIELDADVEVCGLTRK